MNNHGSAENRVRAVQFDERIAKVKLGHTLVVGRHVAQIAPVSLDSLWTAVRFAERIEVSASAGATVGGVAELVNVKAV